MTKFNQLDDNELPGERDVVDVLAKTGILKAENDKIKISLDSADTLNIQPKGTPFGAKVKVERDGSVTPTLTFDTKKLRDKGRYTSPKDALDQALEDFLTNMDEDNV
jgi:hypothetical protein